MCRFLLAKSANNLPTEELLSDFATMCEKSRAPDGDWQGDGWGAAWQKEGIWQTTKSLKPIWEDKGKFSSVPPAKIIIVHARSASFPNQKGKIEYNQPFIENDLCFVFNGLIEGVKISTSLEGEIGAQKIFSLLQKFNEKHETAESMKLLFGTLHANSRKIKGMSVGLIAGEKIYAMNTFSENPDYFTLRHYQDKDKIFIASEPFGSFNWEKLQTKHILIVEDEAPMRRALVDKFTRADFKVIEAKDGVEGLVVALREHPDLIVLDLIMPKMDGIQMMEKLREDAWGKNVPLIILTNLNLEEMKILGKSQIPAKIEEGRPIYYLVKTDLKLEDVVEKARETLGM